MEQKDHQTTDQAKAAHHVEVAYEHIKAAVNELHIATEHLPGLQRYADRVVVTIDGFYGEWGLRRVAKHLRHPALKDYKNESIEVSLETVAVWLGERI